jgi:o-succinylbenzoate synthase
MAGLTMNLAFSVELHKLRFLKPAKTSRNTFQEKRHWLLKIWDIKNPANIGIGEAAPLEFLSPDYREDLDTIIESTMNQLIEGQQLEDLDLTRFPSVKFCIESAILDLKNGGKQVYFQSEFLTGKPIPINGLVWMNSLDLMMQEASQKIKDGFNCIKFKIGSHDFDEECRFLEQFRKLPQAKSVEIRLDANGAFLPEEAFEKMKDLVRFDVHSIEQPVKAGQWETMAKLCCDSKLAVALDEELIGINAKSEGHKLLKFIQPSYIILKPTLLGGFIESEFWIKFAESLGIGWWATSALEGNYGLNALAQWVGKQQTIMPQGLGTGMLYENNFPSHAEIKNGLLYYRE